MENYTNEKTNSKNKRMMLWDPKNLYIEHKLTLEDEQMISEQFFQKYTAINSKKYYRPDPLKDSLFSKEYKIESFDFYDFSNREDCISSLKCEHLREQYFYLIEFNKNENQSIKKLMDEIENENEDNKMCIKELIKRKKNNINFIENILESIDFIIYNAQEAADHFDKMYNIIKNNRK